MVTRILTDPREVRRACEEARLRGDSVGFVPTIGSLHEGHLSLAREAKLRRSFVLAWVFVNPIQFGPNEDLARYPRDLDGDARKLASVGADAVFAPDASDMYPDGDDTRVRVGSLAAPLEGARRPGHFEGVATVVAKLFGIVGPCAAFFGRKDYQQLLVVRRMARDLFFPVVVVGHPTVREPDGLAMSSRNMYLSPDERASAVAIVRGLDAAARAFAAGERRAPVLSREALETIALAATSVDYVEVRDADTLQPIDAVADRAAVLVACRFGSTRLIDNLVLGEDAPPLAR